MKHKHRWQCVDCGAVKQTAKKAKGIQHDQYCYCGMQGYWCYRARHAEAEAETRAMILNGSLSPTWATDARKPRKARKLESVESIKARLSRCACGHTPAQHETDALENVLACKFIADAVGDDAPVPCECDHFHYERLRAA